MPFRYNTDKQKKTFFCFDMFLKTMENFFFLYQIMFMIYFLIFFIVVIVISTNEKVLAIKLELR